MNTNTKKTIYLLSGIPWLGSGKSTWAKKKLLENKGVRCSRDTVRFSFIKEGDEYFSKENEVFDTWITLIRNTLMDPRIESVYVDATHLNDKSRNKTLNRLPRDNIKEIVNVVFTTPIEVCLERNKNRTGLEFVPENVIKNMAKSFQMPKKYRTIFINENGEEEKHE